MLFPGHNYLGPGNDVNNGTPVDSDDRIAQQHDLAYNAATTDSDIREADRRAIFQFGQDTFSHGFNWHSALGATGLSLKYGLESLTGVIYPQMGKRHGGEYDDADSTTNKQVAIQGGDAEMSTSSGSASGGQPGSSMPGGTGASVSSVIISNPTDSPGATFSFKKTFQLYTGGYRFVKNNVGVPDGATADTGFQLLNSPFQDATFGLQTPLATMIPDILAWYMSPAQYENLPPWTYATTCRIKVTPLGYRMPFATNEANSTYANSQTLVQIAYSVGLNTKWNAIVAGYTAAADDLTTPTGYDTTINYEELLYGTGNEDPQSDGRIGASIGIPKLLNNYITLVNGKATAEDIPLIDHICIQNVNDCKGLPIINYEYNFKNGLIKLPSVNDSSVQRSRIRPGVKIPKAQGESPPTLIDNNSTPVSMNGNQSDNLTLNFYNILIEKAPFFNRQLGQCSQPDRPPLVSFGCMPVQANAALSATPAYSDVVVQWMVQTELICHTNYRYADTIDPIAYIGQYDPDVYTTDNILFDILDPREPMYYISNRYASRNYNGINQ